MGWSLGYIKIEWVLQEKEQQDLTANSPQLNQTFGRIE